MLEKIEFSRPLLTFCSGEIGNINGSGVSADDGMRVEPQGDAVRSDEPLRLAFDATDSCLRIRSTLPRETRRRPYQLSHSQTKESKEIASMYLAPCAPAIGLGRPVGVHGCGLGIASGSADSTPPLSMPRLQVPRCSRHPIPTEEGQGRVVRRDGRIFLSHNAYQSKDDERSMCGAVDHNAFFSPKPPKGTKMHPLLCSPAYY